MSLIIFAMACLLIPSRAMRIDPPTHRASPKPTTFMGRVGAPIEPDSSRPGSLGRRLDGDDVGMLRADVAKRREPGDGCHSPDRLDRGRASRGLGWLER